jgi:protein-S-isoprenylcysteine O-methyltransferase Ste14
MGGTGNEGGTGIWKKRMRGIIGGFLNAAIVGLLLFIPAGTLDWPMAWVLVGFTVVSLVINSLMVRPDLIDERTRRHADAKPFDRYLVMAIVLTGLAAIGVSGLDFRYGWTVSFPPAVQATAFVLVVISGMIVMWATTSNPFFSAVIRIQNDRGHSVVSTGPYRYIRHPGYAGWCLYMLCLPLMLGSLVALIPGAIAAGLDVVRTNLEDRILIAELAGYREYAERVRYRLVPGVW